MLEGTNRRSVQSYIEENLVTGGGGKLANLRLMCLLSLTQVCTCHVIVNICVLTTYLLYHVLGEAF